LHGAGFQLAATVVRDGASIFASELPERLVYVLGAEGEGMSTALADLCDMRVSIPGTGRVESLNVAAGNGCASRAVEIRRALSLRLRGRSTTPQRR
jgi:tRNA G18 (ribose-2'-O)-methylase SpoU